MIAAHEKIWPWWLRLSHWLVAKGVFALWILTYGFDETDWLHRLIGYGILGAVALRVVAAYFTAQQSAQITWPSQSQLLAHCAALRLACIGQRTLVAHHGHNPFGQLAVYAMWLLIILLGFTGWLIRTDAFWGEDWLMVIHQILSHALCCLVLLHVVAVLVMSKLQNKNLIKQMLTGGPR